MKNAMDIIKIIIADSDYEKNLNITEENY